MGNIQKRERKTAAPEFRAGNSNHTLSEQKESVEKPPGPPTPSSTWLPTHAEPQEKPGQSQTHKAVRQRTGPVSSLRAWHPSIRESQRQAFLACIRFLSASGFCHCCSLSPQMQELLTTQMHHLIVPSHLSFIITLVVRCLKQT